MALSSKQRDALPDSDFAIVRGTGDNKVRQYPIPDKSHAVNALARVKQNGTTAEKATVKRAVCKRYPDLNACKSS